MVTRTVFGCSKSERKETLKIIHFTLPCVHPIPGGMSPGRSIRFKGCVPRCSDRFIFNLQCGPNMHPGEDIALHLSFRFDQMCVVRNNFTCGKWGVEDRSGDMPLVRGEPFEALVLCETQSMKVSLNGVYFCEFPHRIHYENISHFSVERDVTLHSVAFEGTQAPCSQVCMVVPCVHPIPGGMSPGRSIRFKGCVPRCSDRFIINLQCGPNMHPGEDKALHLSFRFDQMCVVRNNFTCKKWGVEDRSGDMPLVRGEPFEALVLCKTQSMKVSLNGVYFCEFPHRIHYENISHFSVERDVTLHSVAFEGTQAPCSQVCMVVPCVHPIPGGMSPGRSIRFKGCVPRCSDRFIINLQCGPNMHPGEDIALHLSFRFDQMLVVRNNFTWEKWGVEDRSGNMSLVRGEPFEVMVLCETQSMKVSLNGVYFCEFPHRIHYQKISHFSVERDVTLHSVAFEGAQVFMVVPCVHPIPDGMFPGRSIRFKGFVPIYSERFTINLQCGLNMHPRKVVVLHLNFRFDQMCVVRNHFTADQWGVEESFGGMPLVRGEPFEAVVLCETQAMKVSLNGEHFCVFPHRIPYQDMSHFSVKGDVALQSVAFEGGQIPNSLVCMDSTECVASNNY